MSIFNPVSASVCISLACNKRKFSYTKYIFKKILLSQNFADAKFYKNISLAKHFPAGTTSNWRRFGVDATSMSQRRLYDIIMTSCPFWVTNFSLRWMGILAGKTILPFSFLSTFPVGSNLKMKTQNFSRSRIEMPFLEGFRSPGKQIGSLKSSFLFLKIGKTQRCFHSPLNYMYSTFSCIDADVQRCNPGVYCIVLYCCFTSTVNIKGHVGTVS